MSTDTHTYIEGSEPGEAGVPGREIQMIEPGDYENHLKLIPDSPAYLYIRGADGLLDSGRKKICIIGSRKHTHYGEMVTRSLIHCLAPFDPIIISGLATGIDTLALQYALDKKLKTIAVIGSGLDDDSVYPRENISLAHHIVEAGGLMISEYPPGAQANKWHFPMRNRIMAGIADAIIIIEGNRKSGTLITAKLGLDFGRDIICVPGSIFSDLSAGPLSLIQQGAIPLTHPSDILQILDLKHPEYPNGESRNENDEQTLLHDAIRSDEIYSRCTDHERAILDILRLEEYGLDRDDLIDKTGLSISELQITITLLEIKNLTAEKYGKIVRL